MLGNVENECCSIPIFQLSDKFSRLVVIITPCLYRERDVTLPPMALEAIQKICMYQNVEEELGLLVSLRRPIEDDYWLKICKVAIAQSKTFIVMGTDCAERAEKAIQLLRQTLSGDYEVLSTD
ncbi:hypothetical protein ABLA30_01275 [Xenorhabdus nematophila]|uniref:hypothetical protein n=1 Tax=Xenorhabdus nematophila TaxID=628 RepID=UPI0032B7999D